MASHQGFPGIGRKGLVFTVERRETELIRPVGPTPHEFKRLSDIDDQEGLRFHLPMVQFYPCKPDMVGRDPVQAIRDGLARALVYYYPFAGRLREWEGRKLVVECTGEGVQFIEADADIALEEFGEAIQPPFPNMEELLFDADPGSEGILDAPLMLIQVTRLKCGGFIFAFRFNHTMCDGNGLFQLLNAVAEMARGASSPSVLPVWQRELLDARDPPKVTLTHHEFDEVNVTKSTGLPPVDNMELDHRSFFFGRAEIGAMRNSLPHQLQSYSTKFEVLTACLWRCRTIALEPNPEEEVRLLPNINARRRFESLVPKGYYGNAFAYPAVSASAASISGNQLGYSVELVRKAKAKMKEEYLQSMADLMVTRGRPLYKVAGSSYFVSDLTRTGLGEVDFGRGKPVYAGPTGVGLGRLQGIVSFHVAGRNCDGEEGILVSISLPSPAMQRFVQALESIYISARKVQ